MFPDFLEKYRTQIEKYKLDYIKVIATPLKKQAPLPIKQSKFLGQPYWPANRPYPRDKQGLPMILLAQINFTELPALDGYPTEGLLQLFLPAKDWYDMEDYAIVYHPNMDQEHLANFDFLTSDLYEESPVYVEHALRFSKETEYGGTEDFRFDMTFDGKYYYEFQDSLPDDQQEQLDKYFYNTGHKIGGYAYFTQSDPRDYADDKRNDLLVLQIDTDKQIMFGDSGVAHIFLGAEELKNRNFDKAYFYWDCC